MKLKKQVCLQPRRLGYQQGNARISLPSAVLPLSINIFRRHGAQQQTRRTPLQTRIQGGPKKRGHRLGHDSVKC